MTPSVRLGVGLKRGSPPQEISMKAHVPPTFTPNSACVHAYRFLPDHRIPGHDHGHDHGDPQRGLCGPGRATGREGSYPTPQGPGAVLLAPELAPEPAPELVPEPAPEPARKPAPEPDRKPARTGPTEAVRKKLDRASGVSETVIMYPRTGRPKIEVYWENPPGPDQGVLVQVVHGGHVYERRVGPNGYLTIPEAARALRRAREVLYKRVRAGRLKTRMVRGRLVVPVAEVKRLLQAQASRGQ